MSGIHLHFHDPIADAITRLRFAPQSNHLLISSWDSKLRLFDVDANKLRFEAQTEAAHLDCCFMDSSVAYSAGSDGSISRYDLHSGKYSTIGKHDDVATGVEYSHATGKIITTGWDGKILSWDSRTEAASQQHLINFTSHVESITVWGFKLLVATGSVVSIYDLRKLDATIQSDQLSRGAPIRSVRSIPCLEGFAVGSVDGRVTLHSNLDGMGFTFHCCPKSRNGKHYLVGVNDITFNPLVQGVIVTGDYEGHVIAWDARRRRRLLELPRYPNSVASLSYNHTGELLAVASSYTYQEANEIEDHPRIFIQEMSISHLSPTSARSS